MDKPQNDDADDDAGAEGDVEDADDGDMPQGRAGGKPIQGPGLGGKGVKTDARGTVIGCFDEGNLCGVDTSSSSPLGKVVCCGYCLHEPLQNVGKCGPAFPKPKPG